MHLGDITPTRDLLYVKDTANGFVEIFKSDKTIGEEINIATQSEISVGELAKLIMKIMNKECNIATDEERLRPEKSEVRRLFGSNEKILRLTNWKQNYNLESGLENTIKWFFDKENLNKYKSDIYNI